MAVCDAVDIWARERSRIRMNPAVFSQRRILANPATGGRGRLADQAARGTLRQIEPLMGRFDRIVCPLRPAQPAHSLQLACRPHPARWGTTTQSTTYLWIVAKVFQLGFSSGSEP